MNHENLIHNGHAEDLLDKDILDRFHKHMEIDKELTNTEKQFKRNQKLLDSAQNTMKKQLIKHRPIQILSKHPVNINDPERLYHYDFPLSCGMDKKSLSSVVINDCLLGINGQEKYKIVYDSLINWVNFIGRRENFDLNYSYELEGNPYDILSSPQFDKIQNCQIQLIEYVSIGLIIRISMPIYSASGIKWEKSMSGEFFITGKIGLDETGMLEWAQFCELNYFDWIAVRSFGICGGQSLSPIKSYQAGGNVI